MAEERIPTYIPGDEPAYQVVFTCPVNIDTVTATFRNETTGAEISLAGAARMMDKPRVVGTRTHVAVLRFDREDQNGQ